ncbi:hypothetical protein [Mycolicibacterium fallax]|nr:hypothetical protein [Mycolicibacterium fallax]
MAWDDWLLTTGMLVGFWLAVTAMTIALFGTVSGERPTGIVASSAPGGEVDVADTAHPDRRHRPAAVIDKESTIT